MSFSYMRHVRRVNLATVSHKAAYVVSAVWNMKRGTCLDGASPSKVYS